MSENKKLKVIISGGGTGGHIFPALAIAEQIKQEKPETDILFIGAKDRMEMEKVPAAGFPIEGLWISGFQRSLSAKNLSFPFKLISSLMKARKIIKRFNPDLVIGVGGFASGPTLQVAAKLNIPTLIQEQNSYPGITNKLLANKVDKICVAYNNMERFFPKEKIILTGNPVRAKVIDLQGKKEQALEYFGLSAHRPVVLVVGGSLGARTINEAIEHILPEFKAQGVQLIWQTGKNSVESAKSAALNCGNEDVKVHDFISRMDFAYAVADVVVSRAGAIAISELCAVKKPAILIPSPFVAEDHQTKNALALVENNAALLVKDQEAKEKLSSTLFSLVTDETQRAQLTKHIGQMARYDAAKEISDIALDLVK